MLKKLFRIMLCAVFLVTMTGTAFAEVANTADDKIAAIEVTLYGAAQTGPLAERLNKLEKDFEGTHTGGSLMDRINALYDATYDNSAGPSLITQMNALEWAISHKVSMECMQQRVNNMEMSVNGKTATGTFKSRVDALSQFAFGSKEIPLAQTAVPANTLAKVALVDRLNAKNLKKGDVIHLQAAEDVVENGMLLFTKGAAGEGVITKVSQAKNFGRNAEVEIDFKYLTAVDGRQLSMVLGEESQKSMEQMGMAAGASLAGILVLGPIGIIGGAFVQGKNIDLPEGTEIYIQTMKDEVIYAIPTTAE
ncbi:MAG: hypothetical protein PHQ44_07070 [Anaerovibrio sp.]|nr:hypothetical protein [Anaerovibrio sp.]